MLDPAYSQEKAASTTSTTIDSDPSQQETNITDYKTSRHLVLFFLDLCNI